MLRKRFLIGAAVVAAIVVAPIAWYLISPLFIDVRVNEEFPVAQAAPAETTPASAEVAAAPTVTAPMAEATVEPTAAPALPTPTAMAQPSPDVMAEPAMDDTAEPPPDPTPTAPATEPVALKTGQFHDVEHHGSGSATIYRLPDGKHILRFENFDVLNGPDLYVWLSGAPDANDEQAILDGGYIELGRLKGNQGNQNYEIPVDVDLSAFHSVTIWCKQFSVNFATAPLN